MLDDRYYGGPSSVMDEGLDFDDFFLDDFEEDWYDEEEYSHHSHIEHDSECS